MWNSQKILLENAIFARANIIGIEVHAYAGRLFTRSVDAYLQALLQVYNAFFYEENNRFLGVREDKWNEIFWFQTRNMRTALLSTKEYKFELILENSHAQ